MPGIGAKTAARLLKEFAHLEEILSNLGAVTQKGVRSKLEQYCEQARLSKRLATIVCDVPLTVNWEELQRKEPDWDAIAALFRELSCSGTADGLPHPPRLQWIQPPPCPTGTGSSQIRERGSFSRLVGDNGHGNLAPVYWEIYIIFPTPYGRSAARQLERMTSLFSEAAMWLYPAPGLQLLHATDPRQVWMIHLLPLIF